MEKVANEIKLKNGKYLPSIIFKINLDFMPRIFIITNITKIKQIHW
jgi:hypothetical protein